MKFETAQNLIFTKEDKKALINMSDIACDLRGAFAQHTISENADIISPCTGEVLLSESDVIRLNQITNKLLEICNYNPCVTWLADDERWDNLEESVCVKFVG